MKFYVPSKLSSLIESMKKIERFNGVQDNEGKLCINFTVLNDASYLAS